MKAFQLKDSQHKTCLILACDSIKYLVDLLVKPDILQNLGLNSDWFKSQFQIILDKAAKIQTLFICKYLKNFFGEDRLGDFRLNHLPILKVYLGKPGLVDFHLAKLHDPSFFISNDFLLITYLKNLKMVVVNFNLKVTQHLAQSKTGISQGAEGDQKQ